MQQRQTIMKMVAASAEAARRRVVRDLGSQRENLENWWFPTVIKKRLRITS